ncbi:hypothetical protein [Candidatus Poriferisocius sp.]|uniref:hypothetical protein n=1 Tax=Candidatus Poriferisocius sp. TaxID=3101276 RepID=UPI003B024AE7
MSRRAAIIRSNRLGRAGRAVALLAFVVLSSSCLSGSDALRDTGSSRVREPIAFPDTNVILVGAASRVATVPGGSPWAGTGDGPQRLGVGSTTEPIEPERDCSPRVPDDLRVSTTAPSEAGIEISQAVYPCAHEVGLAPVSDAAAIATLVSRGIRGPLLLVDSWVEPPLMIELRRLAPDRIVAAGLDRRAFSYALADFALEMVTVDEQATIPFGGAPHDRVWIVDNTEPATPLAALGHQIGVGVVAATEDLRAASPEEREMIFGASRVEVLFDLGEDAAWQLEVIRRGDEIPGGGLLMFEPGRGDPGRNRRLVAMYGHPATTTLGVLGEQGPEAGIERLRSIAGGYDGDGYTVLPTFEIIATVASAAPGRDGDYSGETARDAIRPWIEAAAANDVYVVLDLQPGRTDFLTQARIYEEFLRLPHVGLALDPEWRLKPDQVHLNQIGTVDAAEINRVIDWLAGIVRREALPQKLLIVHQFRLSMITNRSGIRTPPELAVLIHMDGQGSLGAKYGTWDTLTAGTGADRFHWGWKNFYDEDSPLATPEQVLELTPTPVFVSFQ